MYDRFMNFGPNAAMLLSSPTWARPKAGLLDENMAAEHWLPWQESACTNGQFLMNVCNKLAKSKDVLVESIVIDLVPCIRLRLKEELRIRCPV